MQTDRTNIKKYIPQMLIGALTVFVGCSLILLANGLSFGQISIPSSSWNDEEGYFSQVAAIVDWNVPRGYFGYNGMSSVYGHLGGWAPPLLYPFALIGKIFGWNYMTPIYFNIGVLILSLVIFAVVVRPTIKQQLWVGLAFLAYECTLRYVFSCTPESLVTALFILLASFIYAYKRDERNLWLVLADVMLFLLVILRGYYASFSLILIYLSFKGEKRWRKVLIQVLILLGSIGAFVLLNVFFASPFIIDTYLTDWMTNPIIFVKSIGKGLLESLAYVLQAIKLESMRGVWYLLMFLILIYRFVRSLIDKSIYQFLIFLSEAAIIGANWLIYSAKEGARQVMIIVAVEFMFIAFTESKKFLVVGMLLCSFAVSWLSNDSFYAKIPAANEKHVETIEDAKEVLEVSLENTNQPWDNTILVSLSTYHGDLYAIPSYMGQNYCLDEYLIDNIDSLKAKYVAVMIGEPIDSFMQEMGYQVFATYGQTNIYMIR